MTIEPTTTSIRRWMQYTLQADQAYQDALIASHAFSVLTPDVSRLMAEYEQASDAAYTIQRTWPQDETTRMMVEAFVASVELTPMEAAVIDLALVSFGGVK